MHFAAFIEVGESVENPKKYFENNRDKASGFFRTLHSCGVKKSYFQAPPPFMAKPAIMSLITRDPPTKPINPYGQSKSKPKTFLRMLDGDGHALGCVALFQCRGRGADEALASAKRIALKRILIPRLMLPLIDAPPDIIAALGLKNGFAIYGNDYPTPDGTAIRDYIHVMDLIDAHIRALNYLLKGGTTDIFNLGSGKGFSVKEIVASTRRDA